MNTRPQYGVTRRLEQAIERSYGKSAAPMERADKAQTTLRYMLGKGRSEAERMGAKAEGNLAQAVEATMVDAVRRAL